MAVLEKLEFVPFGPYRFIGKSVYARIGGQYSGVLFGALWEYYSKSVFQTLDQMQEYATQETENVALISGDLYEEKKNCLAIQLAVLCGKIRRFRMVWILLMSLLYMLRRGLSVGNLTT